MQVGSLIIWRDEKFGYHRIWEIKAVMLAGENHEGLVRIKSLNYKPGNDEYGKTHETVLVPEPLIRNLETYTRKLS